jgi:transposase
MSKIRNVGIDEKSFGKGPDYVSIMTDVDNARVLKVVSERTRAAADKLWQLMDDL